MSDHDDEDDDHDDRPARREPRVRTGDRPPVLFLLALAVGTVAMFGCCSLSGWGLYSVLTSGGSSGGGWSLFAANEMEIVTATRSQGFGFGGAPQVGWKVVVKTTNPSVQTYYMVMKGGGVTHAQPFTIPAVKGAEVSQSMPQPALRNTTGSLDLWVETRTDPNKPGKRVSNVYRVP